MNIRTIAKKSIIAVIIYGSFAMVRPAGAFVWPVIDAAQVASFVSNITSGISEVSNTKSQFENATETINSVGDQATAISKYTADLDGTVAQVGDVDLSVMSTDKDISNTVEENKKAEENTQENNKYLADVTVENVESQINSGASSEEIQVTIDDAKTEVQVQTKKMNETYDNTAEEIANIVDDTVKQLKVAVRYLDTNTDIEAEERNAYKEKAETIIRQAENLKANAGNIIENAKEQLNSEYAAKVMANFDAYAQSADDYQSGKIDQETFKQIGNKLKTEISSADIGINTEDITQLINAAQSIVVDSKKLQEDILNSQSNSREYTDDEPEKTSINLYLDNGIKYTFRYNSSRENFFAKEIYFNEDLDEEYQTYILSQELLCHKLKKDNLKELEKHTTEFSECITLAKTEKGYICPLKGIDEDDEKCDPYKLEPKDLYLPYRKDGVYDHIIEDYSVANIQNNARNQQYADSWMRGDDSVYKKLKEQLEESRVDTTRNSYEFMGLIDLEGPKLWNKIRVVDTLYRSKKATQQFNTGKSIYLDKRDADFVSAYKSKPGVIKNIETLKGKVDRQIFSNLFLHHCDNKAKDFSVELKDKYDTEKTGQAEKNIAKCMFQYAVATSVRPKSEQESYCGSGFTVQQCAEIWLKKQNQAINDSSFHTITLATMNNYQSAKDYAEDLPSDETNIITLEDTAKEAKTARDGYAAGAQINYYETMQILGIVDADAQNLQTEILAFMPEIDYNFFDKEFSGE